MTQKELFDKAYNYFVEHYIFVGDHAPTIRMLPNPKGKSLIDTEAEYTVFRPERYKFNYRGAGSISCDLYMRNENTGERLCFVRAETQEGNFDYKNVEFALEGMANGVYHALREYHTDSLAA